MTRFLDGFLAVSYMVASTVMMCYAAVAGLLQDISLFEMWLGIGASVGMSAFSHIKAKSLGWFDAEA